MFCFLLFFSHISVLLWAYCSYHPNADICLVVSGISHIPSFPSWKSVFQIYLSQQREKGERERGRERLKMRNKERQTVACQQTSNTAKQSCKPPMAIKLEGTDSSLNPAFWPPGLLSLKRLLPSLFSYTDLLVKQEIQGWEVMHGVAGTTGDPGCC